MNRPAATASSTDAVLLLGMHRSGTSALARALSRLGLWLGEDSALLPAHAQDNPTGYWERSDVHDAHVDYLLATGHDWDRLAGFRVDLLDDAAGQALLAALAPVLDQLHGHRPWLLKDPRLSVLLPFWQRLVPGHAVVVAVRHPLEIAASLQNTPRGVYPTAFLLLLWQKYMARMFADLVGRAAIFVDYRRLIEAPFEQLQRLHRLLVAQGVAGLTVPTRELASGLFDPALHRQRIDLDTEGLMTSEQQRLLDWLTRATTQTQAVSLSDPIFVEPDGRLAEFEASFDQRTERGREPIAVDTIRRLQRLEEANEHLRKALETQLVELRGHCAELSTRLANDNRMLGIALSDLQHTRAIATGFQHELQQLRERWPPLQQHAQNLEASLREMRASWSWRASAPVRGLAGLLRVRLSGGTERSLYRWYYRLPFLSGERKRKLIVWLHEHAPVLTRHTQSYALYRASFGGAQPSAPGMLGARMDEQRASAIIQQLPIRPRFSIVMPTYNSDPAWLEAALASLRGQFYPDWELCIADDASTRAETRAYLRALKDPRVRVQFLDKNGGISAASNAAIAMAKGDYVGLLDHDDVLSRDALLEMAQAIAEGDHDLLYSDEDKIDIGGRHGDPHFKSGWSPDLLLSQNYICHFLVARKALVDAVGGFRVGFEGSQDHDLLLRLSERSERIHRVAKVLYHWRMHGGSTAANPGAKPASWQAGLTAVQEAMTRRGIDGVAEFGEYPHTYRARRRIVAAPLVSIIIPFRDKPDLLKTCIGSILQRTDYSNFEILGIDNGSEQAETRELMQRLTAADSRVRFLRHDVPFNYSVINNYGASQARGEHLLLLNNDTEVIAGEWLQAMLEHSQRPEVGVVGARLLYHDDTLQHAGVIAGLGGVAGHSHLNVRRDVPGYFCRPHLIQDLSAVTFACAMTRREVFQRLGGLNEADLTIAFNDVDFCLRARELGYRVIYTPYALLYHYESKSRGYEDSPEKQTRFAAEIRYMQARHRQLMATGDPFYNPNFPLNRESFAVDLSYRDQLP